MNKIKELIIEYKEVLLYLIFGILTTVINIIIYMISTKILHINWQFSNIISWILSVLFAYITNRKYVFESKCNNIFKEIISFFSFRILSFILDMGFMCLFVDVLHIDDVFSKFIVQVIVVILNYIFSKLFIFKKK